MLPVGENKYLINNPILIKYYYQNNIYVYKCTRVYTKIHMLSSLFRS